MEYIYIQTCPVCEKEFTVKDEGDFLKKCPECGSRDISDEIARRVTITDNDNLIKDKISKKQLSKDYHELPSSAKMIISDIKKSLDKDIYFEGSERTIRLDVVGEYSHKGYCINISYKDTPVIIGRNGVGKEFLSNDLRVSNEHCYIKYDNNGWYINDNSSTNSTCVNGKEISSKEYTQIFLGDIIRLGCDRDTFELRVTEI